MVTSDTIHFRSGQHVPESGIYAQFDKDSRYVDIATCVEGEPFPPTRCEGGFWRVHVPTKDSEPVEEAPVAIEATVTTSEPVEESTVVTPEPAKMELRWKTPSD